MYLFTYIFKSNSFTFWRAFQNVCNLRIPMLSRLCPWKGENELYKSPFGNVFFNWLNNICRKSFWGSRRSSHFSSRLLLCLPYIHRSIFLNILKFPTVIGNFHFKYLNYVDCGIYRSEVRRDLFLCSVISKIRNMIAMSFLFKKGIALAKIFLKNCNPFERRIHSIAKLCK